MLIVDSHLDLAYGALQWNRDITVPVAVTRAEERGMPGKARGLGTVALPEMRSGNVFLCFATVISRVSDAWRTDSAVSLDVKSQEIAYGRAMGQLAYYRLLEARGQMRQIKTRSDLEDHVRLWESGSSASPPVGYVLAMEGADPIVDPDQVGEWWRHGLRSVSPAHYGVSSYAHGTPNFTGGLLERGPALLRSMSEVGMMLDLTHLGDESFWEALEVFDGPVHASHQNCRELVSGQRQMSDAMLKAIIERDGVVGAAFDNWMLLEGWEKGKSTPDLVSMSDVVDHIEHVCELAGNARHAAIGTDLDGGYGREQSPGDLDTIADLQRIPELLRDRGFSGEDVTAVMHGNLLRLLRRALPEA